MEIKWLTCEEHEHIHIRYREDYYPVFCPLCEKENLSKKIESLKDEIECLKEELEEYKADSLDYDTTEDLQEEIDDLENKLKKNNLMLQDSLKENQVLKNDLAETLGKLNDLQNFISENGEK